MADSHDRFLWAGRVALVTGAGRGAGRALALALAARGVIVAANDISPVNLDPLVEEIRAAGGRANAYIHDIAKKVDVQAMVINIMDDFGPIDLLVNSANVEVSTPLLDIDEWDLHRIFEVNLIGTLLLMQSVGRVMRAQGGGVIVNLVKTNPNAPASFIASQAGIAAMTDRLNTELNAPGIRVFALTDEAPLESLLLICQKVWHTAQ
jgi:NAD(P)-dependent dehydrogenase (short-subunit alcohol dehydrogenase family)